MWTEGRQDWTFWFQLIIHNLSHLPTSLWLIRTFCFPFLLPENQIGPFFILALLGTDVCEELSNFSNSFSGSKSLLRSPWMMMFERHRSAETSWQTLSIKNKQLVLDVMHMCTIHWKTNRWRHFCHVNHLTLWIQMLKVFSHDSR